MQTLHKTLKDPVGLQQLVKKRLSALDVKFVNLGELIAISRDRKRSESEGCKAVELLGLLEFLGAIDGRSRSLVVRTLLRNISEGNVKLSWCSAISLGQLNSRAAVSRLMKIVTAPLRSEIRHAAVYALGALGDPRATGVLSHVLENPMEPPNLRGEAAEALAACGCNSKRAIATLTHTLRDAAVEVRFFSAYALGQCAIQGGPVDELPISNLRRLLKDHSIVRGFGSVAKEAAKSLRQIRSRSSV